MQTYHFNPLKNQNYPPFFQNSPSVCSFRPPVTGLFLPCSLGPKRPRSKGAKLAPKIVPYFTHRNGPIFGPKTDLFDLQCRFYSASTGEELESFDFRVKQSSDFTTESFASMSDRYFDPRKFWIFRPTEKNSSAFNKHRPPTKSVGYFTQRSRLLFPLN